MSFALGITSCASIPITIVYLISRFVIAIFYSDMRYLNGLINILPRWIVLHFFIILPIIITFTQISLNMVAFKKPSIMQNTRIIDAAAIIYGGFCSVALLCVNNVQFDADWPEQLYNSEIHTPLWTKGMPTFIIMIAIGIAGILILESFEIKKLPPLITVACISAIYISIIMSILWIIQVYNDKIALSWLMLLLVPINLILISFRVIVCTVLLMNESKNERTFESKPLQWLNMILNKSHMLPLYAFIGIVPLMGLIIAVLALFGQRPDSAIKVFTQTSQWTLSQQVSPENIQSGHYLCTVAAGGHEKVVKPQRVGIRQGHKVIVNRQLCIANAFEQILEEKTPRFHKAVRSFYDKYGLPISKYIRTKFAADIVYIAMKPLEWIFLTVLYLTDANPENRIAIQYTGKRLKDFDI